MRPTLEKLLALKPLTSVEVTQIFETLLKGELDSAQQAALLVAWRFCGESGSDLAAAAAVMRQHAIRPLISADQRPLADNCGTGGDGANTFNISTAAAIVAAAAGVRLAKHGNRSVSSKCGSADLLFEAGLPATLTSEQTSVLLAKTGFTFYFAPSFHPLIKNVMPVRKSLGVRTIFNLLGPLANPIQPEFQLMGVGAKQFLRPVAEAFCHLGIKRALVVHSHDGLDEISPCAPTEMLMVAEGKVTEHRVDPEAFGIRGTLDGLAGGDAAHNLILLQKLLAGETNLITDAVALNAGALLWVVGKAADHRDGVAVAQGVLRSGQAKQFFEHWIAAAQTLS